MLVIQRAARPSAPGRRRRVGIAIAGGGPLGAMYELGAIRALDDALDGLDLTRLDVYVGVSSGAILAAGLANGIDTASMCRIFLGLEPGGVRFRPENFLRPAFREYGRRVAALPRVVFGWLYDLATRPLDTDWLGLIGRLGAVVPNGLFDNEAIERFLREVFETHGRSNDFRRLDRRLYVVAVDLDSGEVVRFGAPGHDHVPISRAVQASTALPGLYPPVEIDGRHYVDGALRRTLHASVAMDEGVDLVLALNPLVPFDGSPGLDGRGGASRRLVDSGLPIVLSQTFRTLLRSRMQVGLEKYRSQYPGTDLVLFEPDPNDAQMFFTNVFSFVSRARLTEHAYRATLDDLRARRDEIAPLLARYGIGLRAEVLADRERTIETSLGESPPTMTRSTARLRRLLDDLEHQLGFESRERDGLAATTGHRIVRGVRGDAPRQRAVRGSRSRAR